MGDTKTLRLRLHHWRQRRALTIKELAQASKVSSATIVKIENDNLIPRPSVTRKLADALHVTIDELLVDDEEQPSNVVAA